VPHFRKAEPAWLRLPNLTPAQLAAIAAAQLTASGYALAPPLGEAELQQATLTYLLTWYLLGTYCLLGTYLLRTDLVLAWDALRTHLGLT
jgi:hypothetical protein